MIWVYIAAAALLSWMLVRAFEAQDGRSYAVFSAGLILMLILIVLELI